MKENDFVDFETYTAQIMSICPTSAIIKYYYVPGKYEVDKVGISEIKPLTPEELILRKDKIAQFI